MLTVQRSKFPRIPHLPWSPGRSGDDVALRDLRTLEGCYDVVVTEKIDGENTTLYPDYHHARSTTNKPHPSRSWISRWHAGIKARIPPGLRICGENVYAQHSIHYSALSGYFLAFALFDSNGCFSWDETVAQCEALSVPVVPVLYRGPWDSEKVTACWTGRSAFAGEQEGYVVRDAGRIEIRDFHLKVAKYVRPHHLQTDAHWMDRRVIPNGLAGNSQTLRS